MQKYQILEQAGRGHFSQVYKARDKASGQLVAVKDLNFSEEVQRLLMKQLQILSGLDHPTIIKMLHVDRTPSCIRVVFEYMEENLLELYTTSRLGINEHQLRCILFQCALGLEYLHLKRIIHRDIKPQNIMINRQTALVKLIDFGLAKEEEQAKTDYVATRWYRSPENLIGLQKSTVAIDIFALGCVAIEMFNQTPLFPGSDTIDQLSKLFSLLGSPSPTNWPDGFKELQRKNVTFEHQQRKGVSCMIERASPEFKDLMERMLQLDPEKRITAKEMLTHPFFRGVQKVIPKHIYAFAFGEPPKKPLTSIPRINTNPSLAQNQLKALTMALNSDRRKTAPPNINQQKQIQIVANHSLVINQQTSTQVSTITQVERNNHKAISTIEPSRGSSLPMNVVKVTQPLTNNKLSRKVFLSPQKAPTPVTPINNQPSIKQLKPNVPVMNPVSVNQSFRTVPVNRNEQSKINIFIPFRR